MYRTLIKHEIILILKSRKNLLLLLFLFTAVSVYSFIILPSSENVHSFSEKEELRAELSSVAALQESRIRTGATGVTSMGGPAFASDDRYYYMMSAMLQAFDSGNYQRFLYLRINDLERNPDKILRDSSLFPNSEMPNQDRRHLYRQMMLTYEAYINHDEVVTYPLIEEKTAFQTLKHMFLSPAVYIILSIVIYLSSDVLTRDRRNKTMVQALPVPWYSILNVKTTAAFLYSLVVIAGTLVLLFLFTALQHGLGFTEIGIPYIPDPVGHITRDDYEFMPYWHFLSMTAAFIPVLAWMFVRLSLIFGLLFKNEWAVTASLVFVMFSERLYYHRPAEPLLGLDISNFPQYYMQFGKIVTGDKNVLMYTNTLSFGKGMIVLGATIIAVELILLLLVKVINKRRFYA